MNKLINVLILANLGWWHSTGLEDLVTEKEEQLISSMDLGYTTKTDASQGNIISMHILVHDFN